MTSDTFPLSPHPLSLRHGRFVAEYLKDGNATQAYIRAGYSPRGAQPSASKLLRDPRIGAAVTAGRQRIAQALEVDATRLAQEYAKIAFANVSDFVSSDGDGCLCFDLEKASEAQRAGIVELKLSNHRNPEKRQLTLKLGKLQALKELTKNLDVLGRKPAADLTPEDRQRYEERHAADQRAVEASNERYWSIQRKLAEMETALARAEYKVAHADAAGARRAAETAPVSAAPDASSPTPHTPAEAEHKVARADAAGARRAAETAPVSVAPDASSPTPATPAKTPIPRSPQEANSVTELARWVPSAVPEVKPITGANREYLLRSGQLSSYEAMKMLMQPRRLAPLPSAASGGS